ncbi:hypothetical protein GOP47_0012190 [Adiantum capillus-veneris]|uniref:Uncharacterized protein n=1 Tax=Adiantum capillus-veneris TaxID=13818 RepID=A0A9D4ZE83_ADICA|nr:hypothetical protein GOP47_0012190 [Adiantum capillus-veneris]
MSRPWPAPLQRSLVFLQIVSPLSTTGPPLRLGFTGSSQSSEACPCHSLAWTAPWRPSLQWPSLNTLLPGDPKFIPSDAFSAPSLANCDSCLLTTLISCSPLALSTFPTGGHPCLQHLLTFQDQPLAAFALLHLFLTLLATRRPTLLLSNFNQPATSGVPCPQWLCIRPLVQHSPSSASCNHPFVPTFPSRWRPSNPCTPGNFLLSPALSRYCMPTKI